MSFSVTLSDRQDGNATQARGYTAGTQGDEDAFTQRFGEYAEGQIKSDYEANGSLFRRQTRKDPTLYQKSIHQKAKVVEAEKEGEYDNEEEYDNEQDQAVQEEIAEDYMSQ